MSERNTAIVLAAGQGKRMHSKVQKQFLEIQGYPVLYYSLRCFQESPLIRDVILVTGEEYVFWCKEEIVEKYGFTKVSAVVSGGKERYDSVYEGLRACKDTEYVLIHDGARPFIDHGIIERGLMAAAQTGASVTGMPSKDTVKIAVSPNALTPILRRVPGNEILFIFLQSEKVLSPIPVIPDATVTVFIIADLYEKSSVTLTSPFPCICRFPLEYNR